MEKPRRCNPGPDDQGPPMGCVSGVEPAMVLGNSQQREKLKLEAVYIDPELQVLKMEVLNLIRLVCGWVFILTYKLHR